MAAILARWRWSCFLAKGRVLWCAGVGEEFSTDHLAEKDRHKEAVLPAQINITDEEADPRSQTKEE